MYMCVCCCLQCRVFPELQAASVGRWLVITVINLTADRAQGVGVGRAADVDRGVPIGWERAGGGG